MGSPDLRQRRGHLCHPEGSGPALLGGQSSAHRQAAGVQGIRLADGDAVTSMEVVDAEGSLLVVTAGGYGKQTPLKEYTPKGRATHGIATIDQRALEEIGRIASARVVRKDDDLTIITANGLALRMKVKDVKQSGRA